MDCNTARMLVCFARPQSRELAAEDARALEDHLSGCNACAAFAHQERTFDEKVGRAMRAVEVPDRLKAALLKRLKQERGNWYGRLIRRAAPALAAAALVLFAFGTWATWHVLHPPALNLDAVAEIEGNRNLMMPPDRLGIEERIRQQTGHKVIAPPGLNYAYLTAVTEGEYQGKKVPLLVFTHTDSSTGTTDAQALVYILSDWKFDLKQVPPNFQTQPDYAYQAEVVPYEAGNRYAYVVVHNRARSADWLKLPETRGE